MGFEILVLLRQEEQAEEDEEDLDGQVFFSTDLKGYVAAVAKYFNKDIERMIGSDR